MARSVRRKPLVLVMVAVALAGASVVVWSSWRAHEARTLVDEARARLGASLVEAPELDRIQASGAASRLERACELGLSDDPQVVGLRMYATALEDYQRRDLILAAGELTAARHRLGWTPDLRVLDAAIAHANTDDTRAQEQLAAALADEPGHARALLLAADVALDAERPDEALGLLDRLAEIEPRSGPVANRRGLAREATGDRRGAEADYRAAIGLDPRDADPRINLGRLLRTLGHHADALAEFEAAIARAPGAADAHLGRGLSLVALGRSQDAAAAFTRAAELAPNDAEPLLALGDLLRDARRVDEAIATYRRALARDDADAASWLKLGHALMIAGEHEQALAAYRHSARRAPALAAAQNGIGAALARLGRTGEARDALARAAALDDGDPNPWLNLAVLEERAGDRRAARAAWEAALARDPENAVARRHLGG